MAVANPIMERPSSQAGRRGPRRSVAGYDHIEQTQALMSSIIHELVHAGDIAALKEEFLRDQGLIECLNSEGMTPLFVAVSTGNLECVQFLATSGACLDTRENLGRTPLALAAYQGWNDGVYYLLALGADSTIVDNCGRLPLHAATYYSSGRTVELLLQHLPTEFVNKQDSEGMTALHWAAFHGRAEHVKLLIDSRAELLARDTEGKTPLHWTAQNGSVACCQVILNTSAGQHLLNGKDFSGKTPVHYAAAAGHLSALQELINEKFVNIESTDSENRTPLHWAAATGHARCMAALLREGSDSESVDKHSATPLMYAQQGNHTLCCNLLIKHDPDLPRNTEIPENIVEPVRVPTPPEIQIVSESPSSNKIEVETVSNGRYENKANENSCRHDREDTEVQEILTTSLGTVEVQVEMESNSEANGDEGSLHVGMNGVHSDGESAGYSSEDEGRYPPQMVLTPIPSSPVPFEDNNNNINDYDHPTKPPILPRFSFEEQTQAPFLKPPSTASTLAPLKSRTVPEHLRLDITYKSSTSKSFEVKPASPSTESSLAPLKVVKSKQQSPPIKQQPIAVKQQTVTSPTKLQHSSGLSNSREGSSEGSVFSKFWARKAKKPDPLLKATPSRLKLMNRSLSIPEESRSSSLRGAAGYTEGSDYRQLDSDQSDWSRRQKDKQSSTSGAGGKMLPVISKDKSNRVSQVQGSLRDQIEARRKSTKKKPFKTRSVPRGPFEMTSVDDVDEGYEDDVRSVKSSEKKEKKKVRKVMSWNI